MRDGWMGARKEGRVDGWMKGQMGRCVAEE